MSISQVQFYESCLFLDGNRKRKSLVLIKTIELLDYLQSQGLIPKGNNALLPREDLIKQFTKEIAEFNKGRERHMSL